MDKRRWAEKDVETIGSAGQAAHRQKSKDFYRLVYVCRMSFLIFSILDAISFSILCFEVSKMKKLHELSASFESLLNTMHPAKVVFFGYLLYIMFGWLLLTIPFTQKENEVKAIDNLFTVTSAVSTTGLATISIADHYNLAGQIIILVLIQLGGIGYMTFSSFVVLSRNATLSEARTKVGLTVFSLPESFKLERFIKSVINFTIIVEVLGAIALYVIFLKAGDKNPAWSAIFHSISAFCTAGFSLYNNSFESYAGNFWLNFVIAILSYIGAIGFIVWLDIWRRILGEIKQITFTSKIILWMTFWLNIIGTILLFIGEPSIHALSPEDRLIAAFFQTMSAQTTVGFNTINISLLSKASLLLVIVLMIIGSSPSGTGGGMKCTTFSAMIGIMISIIQGKEKMNLLGKEIPLKRIWIAIATFGFYFFILMIGAYLLEMTENNSFESNFFEAASALGTVGLSAGITSALTNLGKLIIIFLMFCGRLGPLTFGIILFSAPSSDTKDQDNDLVI